MLLPGLLLKVDTAQPLAMTLTADVSEADARPGGFLLGFRPKPFLKPAGRQHPAKEAVGWEGEMDAKEGWWGRGNTEKLHPPLAHKV